MLEKLVIKDENITNWDSAETYGKLEIGTKVIEKGEPLFMRLDMEEEVNYIKEGMKK